MCVDLCRFSAFATSFCFMSKISMPLVLHLDTFFARPLAYLVALCETLYNPPPFSPGPFSLAAFEVRQQNGGGPILPLVVSLAVR